MARVYSATKNLYTLNESLASSDHESPPDSDSQAAPLSPRPSDSLHLARRLEEMQRSLSQLQLRNQELEELSQLAERRNSKHEEKQRDLIRKLSHFQVGSQQLAADNRKLAAQLSEAKELRRQADAQLQDLRPAAKRAVAERQRAHGMLRGIHQILKRCERSDEWLSERDRVIGLLQKGLQGEGKINDSDLKFEFTRVDTLREKNRGLEEQLQEAKTALQRERVQKKKLTATYNEKVGRLRELYDQLRQKVEIQEQQSKRKLKNLLAEKNDIIEGLRGKLKDSRTRKSSVEVKKSRESKKSYIGDGDYSHLQLNELNDAIQNLEMQIIKQFEE